jgi:hypothetical protein
MITDSFRGDIEFIFNKLKNKEKFSFSKYADGEYEVLRNQTLTNCDNWTFDSTNHSHVYDQLLDSFTYKDEGYYVGISCPCCQPRAAIDWMRDQVGQNMTWANIFVNSNYEYYVDKFLPEYKNHDVILFSREDSKIHNLPFEIEEHVPITRTAFIDNFDLVENFKVEDYNNKLFLFCAGPLGNMLAAKFWSKNKNNIYLDIGSTLNGYLTEPNRGYLRSFVTINKTCTW